MDDKEKQKWQARFAEMKRTEKTYTTMGSLHTLAGHWVENELIIEQAAEKEAETNGPNWTPDWNDPDSVGEWHSERSTARYMHDETMFPMHRYSCIVMLFTTFERELIRLIENLEAGKWKKICDEKAGRNVSPLKEAIKFVLDSRGVKIPDCPQYEALNDLQKIRDCIIHSKGEVSLSRDKEHLVELWLGEKSKSKKRRGFAAHWNNDIYIYPECIKQFLMEVWAFFVWVFERLNWEIASHWQGDKLEKIFEKLKS
jgi:hypothetical protein